MAKRKPKQPPLEPPGETLPKINLRQRLIRLGWLAPEAKGDDAALTLAIEAYQAFHHLDVDGIAGPVTTRHLTLPRICGVPEYQVNDPRQMRWPAEIAKAITWHPTAPLTGLSIEDTKGVFQEAWRRWEVSCGIGPRYTSNPRTANVVHNVGAIDGRFGTLAWSKLAYTTATQLDQLYDSAEPWVVALDERLPVPQSKIEAIAVATHEIGHVLGIPHIQTGNLLAPLYSAEIRSPRTGDVEQGKVRYGVPLEPPAPPLPPIPPTGHTDIPLSGMVISVPPRPEHTFSVGVERP